MVCQIDDQQIMSVHRQIINSNKFLRRLYKDFYLELNVSGLPSGLLVELGSGSGFIKEIIPQVITSDVIGSPGIDRIFSATQMPFDDESVSAFLMFDVLHHIKDPEAALVEMQRCLKTNGRIIMIEPYNSLWGRFIYKNFHHENFDPKAGWFIEGKERLSDANGALPWIIFVRDRKIFEQKFPDFEIVRISPHTPLRYLLSGGLSHRQFVPTSFYSAVKFIEKIISLLNRWLGMFVTIEIIKK